MLYTSPTCGPCRTLKPIFNGVLDEYAGRVHFVEIDIEEDGEIAEAAGVNGTPTIQVSASVACQVLHLACWSCSWFVQSSLILCACTRWSVCNA